MKKVIFTLAMLMMGNIIFAQATLDHTYSGYYPQIIVFSSNGTKILIQNYTGVLDFYNTDYSFWKTIVIPNLPGLFGGDQYYGISDNLFNSDDSVELVVVYEDSSGVDGITKIINESGRIIQDLDSSSDGSIHYVDGEYKLMTYQRYSATSSAVRFYSLPGSLPCGTCGGLGTEKPIHKGSTDHNASSMPVPNPSGDHVKIFYTLPEGVDRGSITVYDVTGQTVKTFTVTNAFPYIALDNSNLPPGVYYYSLTGNGITPGANKMVVVK